MRFEFRAVPSARYKGMRTWWLVLDRREVDLCLKDPGFDVDVIVTADAATMARVWMGEVDARAGRCGRGACGWRGRASLVQALPGWLLLSHFAHVERPATAG